MRILHTSDWHLGQHFMGRTRLAEHQQFLDWLTIQIQCHEVDVVIVAGDIFDTGTPPSYARELYNNFVVGLQTTGAMLILLGGNHDSVAVLAESRGLLACLNTHVVPCLAESHVMPLKTRQGNTAGLLCPLPFLRARDVMISTAGQGIAEKQQTLQQAIIDAYRQQFERASVLRESLGPLPLITTGHLATVGAHKSDSVREIYNGSLDGFPVSGFPAFDYIALGHIHRPQQVGGLHHVRYSGSPIPLSFDEAQQQKEVLLVDFDHQGLTDVTPLPVPCFQPLCSVRGSLDTLENAIRIAAQEGNTSTPAWLDITVTTDAYISDLQTPLRKMVEGLPVEIVRIHRERLQAPATLQRRAQETLTELTPLEVFRHRLALETLTPELQVELEARYQQIINGLQEPSNENL